MRVKEEILQRKAEKSRVISLAIPASKRPQWEAFCKLADTLGFDVRTSASSNLIAWMEETEPKLRAQTNGGQKYEVDTD